MKKIVFFGSYFEVLEVIAEHHDIFCVFLENKSSNIELFNSLIKKGYNARLIKNIDQAILELPPNLYAISASFGLIFKHQHLNHFSKVINFHPGCLYSNRGKHPLPQAILNSHKTMSVSVHEITDEKIDLGKFIAKLELTIDYSSDYNSNDCRMRSCLKYLASYVSENLDSGLVSCDLLETEESYYPPLNKELLNEIMASENLIKWQPSV